MALASDLMGLGVSPLQAQRTASGGIGPLTITAAGSSFSTAAKIGTAQFVVSCTNANGTRALALPTVGGDTGALLADDFVVNNATTASLFIFLSTSVAISANGTNNSQIVLSSHQTLTAYPITTTQWIGVLGN